MLSHSARITSGVLRTSERRILEAIAEHEPCSVYDLATIRLDGGKDEYTKHGYTEYSYALVHREHQRLLKAGLIAEVVKPRGRRKGPVKELAWRPKPHQRKRSTHLYGLTFRGYVEYAAFSRFEQFKKGGLAAAEYHRLHLKFPLFDHLSVFERMIGSEFLDNKLQLSAVSTLSVTRTQIPAVLKLTKKELRQKPELSSLYELAKRSMNDHPIEEHYGSEDEWGPIEHPQETEAKQHFAISFFRMLSRIPTTDLGKMQYIPSPELYEFFVNTFAKARSEYIGLEIAKMKLRRLLRPSEVVPDTWAKVEELRKLLDGI